MLKLPNLPCCEGFLGDAPEPGTTSLKSPAALVLFFPLAPALPVTLPPLAPRKDDVLRGRLSRKLVFTGLLGPLSAAAIAVAAAAAAAIEPPPHWLYQHSHYSQFLLRLLRAAAVAARWACAHLDSTSRQKRPCGLPATSPLETNRSGYHGTGVQRPRGCRRRHHHHHHQWH